MISSEEKPLDMLKKQRSHLLFIFSNMAPGKDTEFINCYQNEFSALIGELSREILTTQLFRQHKLDISNGEYQQVPFRYLNIVELSLDGAQQAEPLIKKITEIQKKRSTAETTAWLYYPICEKIGRSARTANAMLTIAFANPLAERETEFREWYCTRHIRHALNVSALVSGQCFEVTEHQFQNTIKPMYKLIALYEQEGSPEEIIEAFDTLPEEIFSFPALDLESFAEWIYEPVTDQCSLR